MTMRALPTVAAFASAGLFSLLAHAQTRDPAAADSLFRQAKVDEGRGDYAAACPRFVESQRLDPGPGTLLNEADCEEHLGKPATALAHFMEARDQLKAGDDRIPYAEKRVAALQPKVPHIVVRLAPDAPKDASVARGADVMSPAAYGVPLAVDPGSITFRVTAPGRAVHDETIVVKEGETREVVLAAGLPDVAPVAAATPVLRPVAAPAPLAPPSGGQDRRLWSYIAGGVGVAGLGVGAVTGILAMGAASTFKSHCPGGACDASGLSAASSGPTYATVSTVGFVVGGLGLATGVVLFVTSGPRHPDGAVALTPFPGGGGLSYAARF
jgi:hypothetical protein